jgi:hypothetical protein
MLWHRRTGVPQCADEPPSRRPGDGLDMARPDFLPALAGRGQGWVEQNRASLGVVSRPTI